MSDEHIKAAYKLCYLRVYFDREYPNDADNNSPEAMAQLYDLWVPLPTAQKWIPLFEAEMKRRGVRLTKPQSLRFMQQVYRRKGRKQNNAWEYRKILREQW